MDRRMFVAAATIACLSPAMAQDKVKLVNVVELSGAGATAGTNWKNGIDIAVAEINAKGGILGRQIEIVHYDTQTNPGNTRAAVQRAIDEGTYAVLGRSSPARLVPRCRFPSVPRSRRSSAARLRASRGRATPISSAPR